MSIIKKCKKLLRSDSAKSIFYYLILPLLLLAMYIGGVMYLYIGSKNEPLARSTFIFSNLFADKAAHTLEENANELISLGTNPLAIQVLERQSPPTDWHSLTRQKILTRTYADEWLLCDTTGKAVAANKSDSHGNPFPEEYFQQNHVGEEWFRSSLSRSRTTRVYISDINSSDYNYRQAHAGIDFSYPLVNSSGKLMGILKYRINWTSVLEKTFSGFNWYKGHAQEIPHTMVFNKQGELLFSSIPKSKLKIGKNGILKEPDFQLASHYFTSEDYHYHWTSSGSSAFHEGDSYYILCLQKKFNKASLLNDLTFQLLTGIPLLVVLITQSLLLLRWNKKVRQQFIQIRQNLHRLKNGEAVVAPKSPSSEMIEISGLMQALAEKQSAQHQFVLQTIQGNYECTTTDMHLADLQRKIKNLQEESNTNKFVSGGIAEINRLLYSDDSDTISKFCSTIQQYTGAPALACFLKNENALELKGSWGVTESEISIRHYNLLFESVQKNQRMEVANLPADYLHLQSGLGGTQQLILTLIPVAFSNTTFGVIELITWKKLSAEQSAFVMQAGSALAVYWQYLRLNQYTAELI